MRGSILTVRKGYELLKASCEDVCFSILALTDMNLNGNSRPCLINMNTRAGTVPLVQLPCVISSPQRQIYLKYILNSNKFNISVGIIKSKQV